MAKKIKILYDGDVLVNVLNKNESRSGIFFCAFNIFKELLKREDISLSLLCDAEKYKNFKICIKEKFPECNIKILCDKFILIQHLLQGQILRLKAARGNALIFLFINTIIKPVLLFHKFFLSLKTGFAYDAYLTPYSKPPEYIKKSFIKKCVILHDTIPLILTEYFPNGIANTFFDLTEDINENDYYFANSENTRKDFLRFFPVIKPEHIFTALHACGDRFKPISDNIENIKSKYNIPSDKKYIFSLCTLEPRKNLIRAVKTFIEFIRKNNIDDLVFVLGGGEWSYFINKLEEEIINLGEYKSKIIKAGYVDDEDLPVLYTNAEWFVYTSQYEGFGVPPLEAMSCGCPVITSNNSSLPEVVGDAGIMIDFDSDEQHIQAYEKYYYNESFRNEMAQKGLSRSKQFSWGKCVDEIMKYINK